MGMVTTLAEFKRLILNHLCWVCKYCNAVETFVMTFTTLHVQSGSNHDVHRVVCSISSRGAAVSFRQVRPPYHWRPRPSFPQNKGKTLVLSVLPTTAPLSSASSSTHCCPILQNLFNFAGCEAVGGKVLKLYIRATAHQAEKLKKAFMKN